MIEKKHTLPPFLLRQIKQDLKCDFGGKNAKMQKEAWEWLILDPRSASLEIEY